ncbi:MAG TPA: ABC transporter substrate-binding protein [Candidatus Binataceae bacterium]|nr:ABC transporter substrate-binding protein [Candidatus Binataceae bacterium]
MPHLVMMQRRVTSFAAALTILMLSMVVSIRAFADPPVQDPTATVKAVIDQAIAVFEDQGIAPGAREQRLRSIAENRFDFVGMARSAIGYHWREFTPDQRQEFVPLFTSFIEDVYLDRMEQYSVEKIQQNIKTSLVQFTRQRMDGPDDAEVFSLVTLQSRNDPVQVNYLLSLDDGQWKIYDITVDSISVIANYRNQFNRVLNQGGYDRLVSIMREKQKALSESLAQ